MRVLSVLLLAALSVFAAGNLSNRRAPGFSLPDSQFRQYDLADYRGKVVLLEIMRTSCPSCQKLAVTLERVRAKYGNKIQVLTIVNPPDTQATVAQFTSTFGVKTPVLFDSGQVAASYFRATPQNPSVHVPHLFLIDGNGMIRNDFGYSDATKSIFEGDALYAEIDRLLGPAK